MVTIMLCITFPEMLCIRILPSKASQEHAGDTQGGLTCFTWCTPRCICMLPLGSPWTSPIWHGTSLVVAAKHKNLFAKAYLVFIDKEHVHVGFRVNHVDHNHICRMNLGEYHDQNQLSMS
eukprot:jgi/Botrbrau1/17540/Bobra.0725s0001.1